MGGMNICSVTNFFESNNVANKGLMELGGYSVPGVIMANNKVEARERAEKAALLFSYSFGAPLLFLPILNKTFLQAYKVTDKFNSKEVEIMRLSKKYLAKDSDYMVGGINKLQNELKTKDKFKNIDKNFSNLLKRFSGKEGELQKRLIKVHSKVLLADLIITGALMGSVYWMSNALTKKRTGQEGFSAEFEMADKSHVEKKAKEFKSKHKNDFVKANSILVGGALATSVLFKHNMLSNANNFIKKHAQALDYKNGIYMSRIPLVLITLFGDIPNTLLSSRDNEEFKYNAIKNVVFFATFFGGDLALNNLVGRTLDKTCKGANLVNKEKLPENASMWKKLTAPLYTLKEINAKTNWAPEVLNKTKKLKSIMFWGDFAIVTAFMGFGLPHVLNKMVKNKVKEETKDKIKK